jgi:chromosome segregation ATPase
MAQKKWKQVRKENGLHVVLFDDGREVRLTDSELHELKTGSPLTDKEAAKVAATQLAKAQTALKAKDTEIEDLKGQLNVANSAKEELQTKHDNLERERDTLKTENQTLTQQVKDLQGKKPAAETPKAQTAPQERKDVPTPPETK